MVGWVQNHLRAGISGTAALAILSSISFALVLTPDAVYASKLTSASRTTPSASGHGAPVPSSSTPKARPLTPGTNQYSAPTWYPLPGSSTVACTYQTCNGYHPYWALDLAAPFGTPVYAAGAGVVTVSAQGSYCTTNTNGPYYGNIVYIQHGPAGSGARISAYVHLDTITPSLNGQWVDQGTQIGTVGVSGIHNDCNAPYVHLHFEEIPLTARYLATSASLDPGSLTACQSGTLVSEPGSLGKGFPSWANVPPYQYSVTDDRTCINSGSHSTPAVTSRGSGMIDVFFHGTDNLVYHYLLQSGNVVGSDRINGFTLGEASNLAAVANAVHSLDLFGRGTDGVLYSTYLDAQGWHPWGNFGGAYRLAPGTSPTAASQGPGSMDVFFVGTNYVIYHLSWRNGAMVGSGEGITGFTPAAGSSIGVVANTGLHQLDIYGHGTDDLLYSTYFDGSWGHGWVQIPSSLAPSTSPSASSTGPGSLDIFYHSTSDVVDWRSWQNGNFVGTMAVPGFTPSSGSSLAPIANAVHPWDLFARGTDGVMYSTYWDGYFFQPWISYPNAHLA